MKHPIARALTVFVLFVVWPAITTQAQSRPWVTKVKIPFAFNLGDRTFPAGDYSLTQPLQHFLLLRDSRGQVIASAFTGVIDSTTPVSATTLKFRSSGGQHILTEVWQQQETSGQHLYPSRYRAHFARHRPSKSRTTEGSQP